MTVRQLLSSLDSRELCEWHQFFRLERERRDTGDPTPVEQKLKAMFKAANE